MAANGSARILDGYTCRAFKCINCFKIQIPVLKLIKRHGLRQKFGRKDNHKITGKFVHENTKKGLVRRQQLW